MAFLHIYDCGQEDQLKGCGRGHGFLLGNVSMLLVPACHHSAFDGGILLEFQKQMGFDDLLHLFLKLKHDAIIKGRMVAGRDKQHGYIPKEKATFPTTSLKLVLLTTVIDMQEGQDIAICNIPNAFIQT